MNPIQLFDRLVLWKKFLCLGLLCLAVVTLPTLFYINEVRKLIACSKLEQQGLVPAQLMLNIIQRTQQHRGLSARYLSDPVIVGSTIVNPSVANSIMVKKERRRKAEDLEQAIADFEAFARKNNTHNIIAAVNEQTLCWHKLSPHLTLHDISPEQSFQFHSALIRMQLNILQMIIDNYQLSLDSQADGHFLIAASLIGLPELTEIMDQMQATGVVFLIRNEANFFERVDLKSLLLFSAGKIAEVDAGVHKAAAANPTRAGNILGQYNTAKARYQKNVMLTQEEILNKEHLIFSPADYYTELNNGIDEYFNYATFSLAQINNILQDRIHKNHQTILMLLIYIVVTTALVTFIGIRFARNFLVQLDSKAIL